MEKPFDSRKVLGFYGYSNSGKTSLIFRLVSDLTGAGYKVAVVKRTDKDISSESTEKDTSGYRAAGACLTSFSSTNETNFVIPKQMDVDKIIQKLHTFDDPDLILIEGAFEPHIEKIRVGIIPQRENTIITYQGDYSKLKNYVLKKIEGEA